MSTEPKRKILVGLIIFGSIIGLIGCGIIARFALSVLGGLGGLAAPPSEEDWATMEAGVATWLATDAAVRATEAKLAREIRGTVEARQTQEPPPWATVQARAWVSDETPNPGDTITVTGQMLVGDGQPFIGADVYCEVHYSKHAPSRYPDTDTVTTGSDGSATIMVTVPRNVTLGSPVTVNVYFSYKKSWNHSATTRFTPTSR